MRHHKFVEVINDRSVYPRFSVIYRVVLQAYSCSREPYRRWTWRLWCRTSGRDRSASSRLASENFRWPTSWMTQCLRNRRTPRGTAPDQRENPPLVSQPRSYVQIKTGFLPRDAMRKRDLCCSPVSVLLSVTFVHSIQMVEDIVKLLGRLGSPINLFFWSQRRYPIPRELLQRGCKIEGGGKIWRFSTEIAVYLWNGTR